MAVFGAWLCLMFVSLMFHCAVSLKTEAWCNREAFGKWGSEKITTKIRALGGEGWVCACEKQKILELCLLSMSIRGTHRSLPAALLSFLSWLCECYNKIWTFRSEESLLSVCFRAQPSCFSSLCFLCPCVADASACKMLRSLLLTLFHQCILKPFLSFFLKHAI